MANKYTYLFKNIGLLTLSNFATKLLSFFLVPLYTNILTTEEYGSFDFICTTVSLIVPIFTLDIVDAVTRFSLDKEQDRQKVFTVGVKLSIRSYAIMLVFLAVNYFTDIMPVINQYLWCFMAYYFSYILSQLMFYFVRGMDDTFDLAISTIIQSVFMLSLNILFLVVFKFGIEGYFAAYIIAQIMASLYIIIRLKAWRFLNFRINTKDTQKEMVSYSKPLVLNMISWWINSTSDRYVVSWICGLSANGLLAVGNKIPSILNIFQTVFLQSWQLSTVKAYDKDDKDGFFANIYTMYNFLMVEMCSVLTILDKPLARLLYAKDFFEAWRFVPFYLLAIVFGAVSSFCGGIFQAVKDSKAQTVTTVVGAVSNIVINLVLVFTIGPIGAAIATAASYMIVWAVRLKMVKKYITLRFNLKRDIVAYVLLIVQSVLLLELNESVISYAILTGILIVISLMYFNVMKSVLIKAKDFVFEKLRK